MQKKNLAYEAPNESIADAIKILKVIFCNAIVDTTIECLTDRFETQVEMSDRFRVLFNFQKVNE